MTRIRVVPDDLRQAASELKRVAQRLRDLGREAHQATNAAPSYGGQFGPKARALGMEAEVRLVAQAEQVLALSEALIARAEAFEAVDLETLTTIERLIGLIQGWLEDASTSLAPLSGIVAFPWQLVNRYLRLGLLIEDPGDGDGDEGEWTTPWWSSIAIGASNVWNWYDHTINRFIYKTIGMQASGFPADGPITPALLFLNQEDSAGNVISPVGVEIVRLINQRGVVTIWFNDTLTAGGSAGVAPMKGLVWLPEEYSEAASQEVNEHVILIAHELEHVLQRDLVEYPDGRLNPMPRIMHTGSWPFSPKGFDPFNLDYGAPLIGDFTLFMEVQSNIVEKTIHYDLLSAELSALPSGDPARTIISNQMQIIADKLATYTGESQEACVFVVQDHGYYGMYTGEMIKEIVLGERLPPWGWETALQRQGFSEEVIQHIADIANSGTAMDVEMGDILKTQDPASQASQVLPAPVPTPQDAIPPASSTPSPTSPTPAPSSSSTPFPPSQTPTPESTPSAPQSSTEETDP